MFPLSEIGLIHNLSHKNDAKKLSSVRPESSVLAISIGHERALVIQKWKVTRNLQVLDSKYPDLDSNEGCRIVN